MKNKIKYAGAIFAAFVVVIISINIYQPNKEQKVRGQIEVLVNEDSYDYLVESANNFMKLNDKTYIKISKIDDYTKFDEIMKAPDKTTLPIIGQINRFDFENLEYKDLGYYEEETELINTYTKNFAKYRISQVKSGDEIIGIPLNSRPLGLYVREDILRQYGYKRDDMNTWKDVIVIGKDIYERSDGKIKIINAIGQDYEDLLDLLTMEFLNDESVDDIKLHVENMIKELKDNNILNFEEGGEFLARISSINAMREIMGIEEYCEWSIGNVPSLDPGTNKFFAGEGDNLIIINQNSENSRLIEKFITYVITNNKDTIKYVKKGNFFSSYLYTYKSKEIEEPVKNFVGKSPLIVLSNIEEKTLELFDYDKYIEVKKELRVQ